MSEVHLVEDLNNMIIDKFIHDYPTFRRFLLTFGEDREQIVHYIRKYTKKFITNIYVRSFKREYIFHSDYRNFSIITQKTSLGSLGNTLEVTDHSKDIPFFEDVTKISFQWNVSTLKHMKLYSDIQKVEISGFNEISPEDFVRAFPKLRELKSLDINFIDRVLAISTTIKKVEFSGYDGIKKIIPLKYPNVEFISIYDNMPVLYRSGVLNEPKVNNLKCRVQCYSNKMLDFNSKNIIIESLCVIVKNKKTIVIPKQFKDLRFLSINFYVQEQQNVDIIIDGFPHLEFIAIYSCSINGATCRIANVPYIFCLKISKYFALDIDHETVSIFEQRE